MNYLPYILIFINVLASNTIIAMNSTNIVSGLDATYANAEDFKYLSICSPTYLMEEARYFTLGRKALKQDDIIKAHSCFITASKPHLTTISDFDFKKNRWVIKTKKIEYVPALTGLIYTHLVQKEFEQGYKLLVRVLERYKFESSEIDFVLKMMMINLAYQPNYQYAPAQEYSRIHQLPQQIKLMHQSKEKTIQFNNNLKQVDTIRQTTIENNIVHVKYISSSKAALTINQDLDIGISELQQLINEKSQTLLTFLNSGEKCLNIKFNINQSDICSFPESEFIPPNIICDTDQKVIGSQLADNRKTIKPPKRYTKKRKRNKRNAGNKQQ